MITRLKKVNEQMLSEELKNEADSLKQLGAKSNYFYNSLSASTPQNQLFIDEVFTREIITTSQYAQLTHQEYVSFLFLLLFYYNLIITDGSFCRYLQFEIKYLFHNHPR